MGYSREVYDFAGKEMEQRRIFAEQELEKRRNRLYEICPRTREIERELIKISACAGKRVIMGADVRKELEILKNKSLILQKELSDLLEKYNLPKNYLEEWYVCDKCGDTGNIDGKVCSCLKKPHMNSLTKFLPFPFAALKPFHSATTRHQKITKREKYRLSICSPC